MKKIWIFIVLFFISTQLIGQDKSELNEIIISSINTYISWNNDLVKKGNSLMDTTNYYICMDGLPSNFPYDNIKKVTFFSLNNINGLPYSFKVKLKKGIKVLFVDMNLSANRLVINVLGRGVNYIKKNNINMLIGDRGIFTYEYSCDKLKWELIETKLEGI